MLKEMIGMRIKELRISKKNMNQEDFANCINADRAFLSRIESGKQNLTLDSILKVCSHLDVSLSEFFEPFTEVVKVGNEHEKEKA